MATFDINEYLNKQSNSLNEQLSKVTSYIRTIHQQIHSVDPNDDRSPLPKLLGVPDQQEITPEEAENETSLMVVVRIISILEDCTRKVVQLTEVLEDMKTKQMKFPMSEDEFNKIWSSTYKNVRKYPFGRVLDRTDELLKKHLPDFDIKNWEEGNVLRSFNKLRNCLLHRLGIISDLEKTLEIVLPEFILSNGEELEIGKLFKEATTISLGFNFSEKKWALNDQITISLREAQNMCLIVPLKYKEWLKTIKSLNKEIRKDLVDEATSKKI